MNKKGNVNHLTKDRYLYHSRPWRPSRLKNTNPYRKKATHHFIKIIPGLARLLARIDYFFMILVGKIGFLVPPTYLQKFLFKGTNISMLLEHKCQTNWGSLNDMLCDLFSEALYLQRIPILPTICLGEKHITVAIRELLDLGKSSLMTPTGEIVELTWIEQKDYIKMHQIFSFSKFTLSDYIDESTNASVVLAVRHGRYNHDLSQGLKSIERVRFISQIRDQVHLEPVKRITDAIEKISTRMKNYYFLSYQNPFSLPHIGRINNLQDLINEIGFLYPKKHAILKPLISGQGLLKNLTGIYPEGSKLYIASQLPKAIKLELFTPLQQHYDVFEANDFLELTHLNLSPSPIDEIELEIHEEGIRERSMRAMDIKFLPQWSYPFDWEDIVKESSENRQGFSEGLDVGNG